MRVPALTVAHYLDQRHYLGAAHRGFAWSDEHGVAVFGHPTSRRLPQDGTWLELTRWCLEGERNGGSKQWAAITRHLKTDEPNVTTIVSYSDPSHGHTGALYKACNWIWAPTWHRLRPPPSGNGHWIPDQPESVKDRWIFPLRRDPRRAELLYVNDDALLRKDPTIGYHEPKRFAGPHLHSVRHGPELELGSEWQQRRGAP